MNTHQALGHMRALMNAQRSIHQAQLKIRETKDVIAAKQLLIAATKEIASVKDGLSLSARTGESSTAEAMLRLFFEETDKTKRLVEGEILFQKDHGSQPRLTDTLKTGARR